LCWLWRRYNGNHFLHFLRFYSDIFNRYYFLTLYFLANNSHSNTLLILSDRKWGSTLFSPILLFLFRMAKNEIVVLFQYFFLDFKFWTFSILFWLNNFLFSLYCCKLVFRWIRLRLTMLLILSIPLLENMLFIFNLFLNLLCLFSF